MAVLIKVNNFLEVDVSIKNIGQQNGTFSLSGNIFLHNTYTPVKQKLYNAKGYSTTNPPPSGAQYTISQTIAPNETIVLKAYSDQWKSYTNGQLFDILFQIYVLETSENNQFWQYSTIQFST